jgi:peroxiredoxin
VLVSDGQDLWGAMENVPDQVLRRKAPAEVTVESIYPDPNLADALAMGPTQNFSWLPVQLILLLADDPLKTLLYQSKEPELLEPARIGQAECHRVRVQRQDGASIFWIDRDSHVLRRFEFPTNTLHGMLAEAHGVAPEAVQGLSMVAEFQEAELGGQIDAVAFEFQAPAEARVVEYFMPSDLEQLGKPAPDFSFPDLEGKPVTRQSLAGKIAVLGFWATSWDPCREALQDMEEVYQKYKDNEKVVFWAVSLDATTESVDQPRVEDEALREMFKELDVTIPMARDPQQQAYTALKVGAIPMSIVLGPDGVVQHRKTGGAPPGAAAKQLSAKLERLLAGQAVFEEDLKEFEQAREAQRKGFEQLFRKCVEKDLYLHPMLLQQELVRAEIAERTQPRSVVLTRLWSCTELAAPGNILVVPRPDGPPQLLVLDGVASVAEIGLDGAVDAMHPLELPPEQFVTVLRTDAGSDGRRYFLGAASFAQQLYLFDDQFKLLVGYPKDALENPHKGIADVQLGDLDGDGTLEICVGYMDVVGVQGVSLQGERLWANRSLATVLQVAVLGADADGRRNLLCTNEQGTLVVLDGGGRRQGEITVPGYAVYRIWAADLDGDDQPELCGLSPTEPGDLVAVGLDLKGEVLWNYPLPHGVHECPIEAVTSGRLLSDKTGQWLVAAADGSIHILAADGKLLDRFNYGAPLTGLATAQWDGKRVLLVSTPQSVDAWEVQPPGTP